MIKTIPLVTASLKGFIRNYKSIFLLIVVPLLLISTIFIAFNPLGLQKTPIGVITSTDEFNVNELNVYVESFMELTDYPNIDSCMLELMKYNEFVCMDIKQNNSLVLDVYFDNTRTPIIWEIIARIKGAIDWLKKEKSMELTNQLMEDFRSTTDRVDDFKDEMFDTQDKIDGYIEEVDSTIRKLKEVRSRIDGVMYSVDDEVDNLKIKKSMLKSNKDMLYSSGIYYCDYIENLANDVNVNSSSDRRKLNNIEDSANELQDLFIEYNEEVEEIFEDFDTVVDEYDETSSRGNIYINQIDEHILKLQGVKQDLIYYRSKIGEAQDEINRIQGKFEQIESIDPEVLINPIVLNNIPAYIPDVDSNIIERFASRMQGMSSVEKAVRGISLINLQTIFPMILFLITIFLCLLVSSFICLGEINSSASTRIRILKNVFFHEFLSVFISSFVIIFIPLISVLILGNFLFVIDIIGNFGFVLTIMVLVSSVFILFGMSLSYLIKKESTTLLISTFILVFLMFFSGFLLPIERMTSFAATIASHFPGNLALNAFNKVVFYQQGYGAVVSEIGFLIAWCIGLVLLTLIIKKLRNV